MRATRQLSITLPTQMAEMIKRKVASGDYASESEVIREGLRSLQERDSAVEQWLRNEAVPALLAYEADPSQGIPIDVAFDGLEQRRQDRKRRAS
jgi:putative addiction module CopG family antidote